jgi:hypothetical protein
LENCAATREKLLAGALAYAAELKAKSNHDLKYTRHPLNWLKERGWLDEYPISARPDKNSNTAEKANTSQQQCGRAAIGHGSVGYERAMDFVLEPENCEMEKTCS